MVSWLQAIETSFGQCIKKEHLLENTRILGNQWKAAGPGLETVRTT